MQFRCLQVAKSIHPAYKCDLSFCRGPSISMTRPRNHRSPPFALSLRRPLQIEQELHGIFCLERPRSTSILCSLAPLPTQTCECECFVPIVHDRSTQLLTHPRRGCSALEPNPFLYRLSVYPVYRLPACGTYPLPRGRGILVWDLRTYSPSGLFRSTTRHNLLRCR